MTALREGESPLQLRMVWPEHRSQAPPTVALPHGHSLRTYEPGDEPRFFEVMELAGWPGWDAKRLRPWRDRVLSEGWFMVVHEKSNEVVATGMALRDRREFGRQGGEIGWIAVDPAHRGKGLGATVSAAATTRLLEEGYRDIHLYSEDWRLAALRIYLELGYNPLLYASEMLGRWRTVCAQLEWPFTPEKWKKL